MDELKAHIDNYKSDILFVTETWLTESIPNEAVNISGFNIFRKDRTKARGGGVAIYIKDDIPVKTRFDLNSSLTIECLWITIRPKWLACVYLPPSILYEDVDYFYDYFQSCYHILTAESCDTAFIIAGDFNPICKRF